MNYGLTHRVSHKGIEMPETEKTTKEHSALDWLAELKMRENDAAESKWVRRGKSIVKRFRDEREMLADGARFNILWSNIETLLPAVYSRPPKAEVSRRNKDADPVARTAARILERALQYEIDQYPDFDQHVKAAILDRLLPGRGVAWIRFEEMPVSRPGDEDDDGADIEVIVEETPLLPMDGAALELPPEMQAMGMQPDMMAGMGMMVEPEPVVPEVKERAVVDYVYWEDFRHGEARMWADVPWVARRVYLTRDEGVERFGAKFRQVTLNHQPIGMDEESARSGKLDSMKKAAVWEIWDRRTKTQVFVAEGFDKVLDERDDPYGLEEFFPCPRPLYATQTTDQLTPVPDFSLYQDQAEEIDLLTTRIAGLSKALKLNGAYDAGSPALARILESPDNTLIPVENWAGLSEKGGLGGVMEWVPLREVVAALQAAWEAREQAKQVIYEITGISDIIRGATKASETATAQDIKRQFGSLRLQTRQRDVAVFCTEILRIKSQIMCDIYSPETLLAMSGIQGTEDAQYADEAILLLQSEPLREYQITVASDSLVAMDEEQEKAQRMEFLQAVGGYIQQAMQAAQQVPEIAPLALSLMMFAVRAFPAAKPIEAEFERFQEALQNRPPEDPNADEQEAAQAQQQAEMAKLQATMQVEQMKLQMQSQMKQAELQADAQANQIRAQADIQVQQARLTMQGQLEQQRAQMQAEIDRYRADVDAQSKASIAQLRMEFDRWKAELDAAVKVQVANIGSKTPVDNPATQTATREIADEVRP